MLDTQAEVLRSRTTKNNEITGRRLSPRLTRGRPDVICKSFAIIEVRPIVNIGREDFHLLRRPRTAWTRNQKRSGQNLSPALEIIRRTLIAEGYSQTKPRRQVLEVFLQNDKPLTPAAVHKRLAGHRINLASVYRAIELFCRVRVLAEVDHVQEGRRYELSDEYRGHHHHLICDGCGNTEDFEDCEMDDLERLIRKRFHFKVRRHDLRFIGLCRSCQ